MVRFFFREICRIANWPRLCVTCRCSLKRTKCNHLHGNLAHCCASVVSCTERSATHLICRTQWGYKCQCYDFGLCVQRHDGIFANVCQAFAQPSVEKPSHHRARLGLCAAFPKTRIERSNASFIPCPYGAPLARRNSAHCNCVCGRHDAFGVCEQSSRYARSAQRTRFSNALSSQN